MFARLFALMIAILCASAMVVEPDNQVAFYLRGTDEKDSLNEVSKLLHVSSSSLRSFFAAFLTSSLYMASCTIDRSLKTMFNSGIVN
jgi:hypothetical protein